MLSRHRIQAVVLALIIALRALPASGQAPQPPAGGAQTAAQSTASEASQSAYTVMNTRPVTAAGAAWSAEQAYLMAAARSAWQFFESAYQPKTGLVSVLLRYKHSTLWDIASGFAGLYSAKELGLLPQADYNKRMRLALNTLKTMPLFDNTSFNKNYIVDELKMLDRNDKASEKGNGWSPTDLGRFLIWMKIIAKNDPQFAGDIDQVVKRINLGRMIENGYLMGEDYDRKGERVRYQEGRIGYEQYAALGFALWGHPAAKALSLKENTAPVTVLGVPLLSDKRGDDRLTSEPFILAGLELGWSPEMKELAANLVRAQEQRYLQTKQVTAVSEDAIAVPPYYFYYYSVYHNGKPFSLDVQAPGVQIDSPRIVSTKATFGWHALLPQPYTWTALQYTKNARGPRGWAAGVMEKTGSNVQTENVNTNAIVLESTLYALRGQPLIFKGKSVAPPETGLVKPVPKAKAKAPAKRPTRRQ
jgi:hypothetical protein